MRSQRANMVSRRGFSLVELLVVISIIAVLLGLAAGATMQVISVQRDSNTKVTMQTFDKTLRSHVDWVVKEAAKEIPSPAAMHLASDNAGRARVIWIKLRLAEAFPQCYDEVKFAMQELEGTIYGVLPATIDPGHSKGKLIPAEVRKNMKGYWAQVQKTINANTYPLTNPLAEPAACLSLSLMVSRGGEKLDEKNLVSSITDTDGDGIKELIDGFGKPLRFQRSIAKPDAVGMKGPYSYTLPSVTSRITPEMQLAIPTELAKSQGELAAMNLRGDPVDGDGYLRQTDGILGFWCHSPKGQFFALVCNTWFPLATEGAYFVPTPVDVLPQPFFLPHLVSGGRDETMFTDDDIYSFRLKGGS